MPGGPNDKAAITSEAGARDRVSGRRAEIGGRTALNFPGLRRSVLRSREQPLAIRTELNARYRAGVLERFTDGQASKRIPEPAHAALRSSGDSPVVRAEAEKRQRRLGLD